MKRQENTLKNIQITKFLDKVSVENLKNKTIGTLDDGLYIFVGNTIHYIITKGYTRVFSVKKAIKIDGSYRKTYIRTMETLDEVYEFISDDLVRIADKLYSIISEICIRNINAGEENIAPYGSEIGIDFNIDKNGNIGTYTLIGLVEDSKKSVIRLVEPLMQISVSSQVGHIAMLIVEKYVQPRDMNIEKNTNVIITI